MSKDYMPKPRFDTYINDYEWDEADEYVSSGLIAGVVSATSGAVVGFITCYAWLEWFL